MAPGYFWTAADGEFVNYVEREPDGFARCIGCDRQWDARFVNDAGICTMCRMPVMVWPANPLLATGDEKVPPAGPEP